MNQPASPTARTTAHLTSWLFKFRAVVALLLLGLVFAMLSPEFLTTGNLTILLKHVAINAILAIGMTFVIVSGGIDLSVGSTAGLTGMVAGLLLGPGLVLDTFGVSIHFSVWLVIALSLLLAMTVGAVNGLLVARLRVPPFIATLGMLHVVRGAALLISDGATFPNLAGSASLGNTGFLWLGSNGLFGLPTPIWLMIGLTIVAVLVARRTVLGRQVQAVGGNERAALLAGVRVRRVKFTTYVMSGGCAGLVGLIIAAQLEAAHPATGTMFELDAIAAVVLGGASLMGGRGTVIGALIGAMVIGVLANGLVLLDVSEFWQMVIKGAVIVAAVIVDQSNRR